MERDTATEAIHHLTRAQWWDMVHAAIDEMTVELATAYRSEAAQLDDATADGLDGR